MQEIAGDEISSVITELARIVRQSFGDNRKLNLVLQKPDYSKAILTPLAAVYDAEFEAEELGFGGELGEGRDEKEIVISGDGKTTSFPLPSNILKPFLKVRTKEVLLSAIDDYTISFDESLLSFRSPPSKNENVNVRYMVRRDGEDKGMRLRITCHVDLWTTDDFGCNMMALMVMKETLKAADELQTKGIRFLPRVKGEPIVLLDNDNTKETVRSKSDVRGKRLVYICELNFKVKKEPGFTRIKQIHIKQKK